MYSAEKLVSGVNRIRTLTARCGSCSFTKYLSSIQRFNILESLDLFFSTIEQLLGLKLIVSEAIIAQS